MWFLWCVCCVCWFSQPHHVCWYRTGHRCHRCQTTTAWRPALGEGSPQLRTEQPSSPCWSQTREKGERREKALVWRPLQLTVWTQGWSFFLDYELRQWVERFTVKLQTVVKGSQRWAQHQHGAYAGFGYGPCEKNGLVSLQGWWPQVENPHGRQNKDLQKPVNILTRV